MKTNRQRATKTETSPVLAAAVGLGDITLDTVTIRPGQTLRVGDGRDCDLPFTCSSTEIATRDQGSWLVGVPEGAEIPGASAAEKVVRLQDWNPGVTIRDGEAWLKVWPTRREAFDGGPGMVHSTARGLGRALPVMWLALSLTLGVGTFGVWASGLLGGGSGALALGEGGGRGVGIPERFATFGDGDLGQPGESPEVWIAMPTPEDDATADETETETEIETETEVEPEIEPEIETETETEPEPELDLSDDALAIEEDVAEPMAAPTEAVPEVLPEAIPETAASRKAAKAGKGDGATTEGGASGFGLGGGTDDGYADRNESLDALEMSLAACMEGRHTRKLTLEVDPDGKLKPGSVEYAQGWTSAEQSCVDDAIADWAFPSNDDTYEVSLRVRKGRGGRV